MAQDKKIRVLWFSNTSVDYTKSSSGYNGGGWISALKDKVIEWRKSMPVEIPKNIQ